MAQLAHLMNILFKGPCEFLILQKNKQELMIKRLEYSLRLFAMVVTVILLNNMKSFSSNEHGIFEHV